MLGNRKQKRSEEQNLASAWYLSYTHTAVGRLGPEGVCCCWEVLASLELCQHGVRAWAASLGRVIPSMAGGPVLWQLFPFEVLSSC